MTLSFPFPRRHLLTLFSFLIWLGGYGQQMTLSRQLIFEQIDRRNTHVFLEDSLGFIWIGGSRLYRYDGYAVQAFRAAPNDSLQVSTGAVHSLLEDSKKRIWVGATNGLFQYHRETNQLKKRLVRIPKYQTPHSKILSLFEDSAGRLWIGDREYLYVMANPEVDEYQIIEGIDLDIRFQGASGFTSITQDKQGEIFVTSTKGVWQVHSDYSAEQFLPESWKDTIAEFQIMDAAAQGDSMLWLATSDGLWAFNTVEKTFSKKELPPEAGNVFLKVITGVSGEVWLGTKNNALYRLTKEHIEHFPHDPNNTYSLFDNSVKALLIDRFRNLWVGTMTGINRINFEQQKFPFYQVAPGPYRHNNFTFRVLQDSLGGLWFRLMRLGLGYSPGVGRELEILLQPKSSTIGEEIKNFCVDPDGNVWIITLTKGLYRFDKGTKKYRHFEMGDSMQLAYTHTILSDRIDRRYLWFSSQYGVCRVNRFTAQRKWFNPKRDLPWLDTDFVGGLSQSEDGNFWCTLRTKGRLRIVYFDRQKEMFIAPPRPQENPSSAYPNRNYHIVSVPDNKIWIGTQNGVLIINATDKTITSLNPDNGFPLALVKSITPDLEGNIWFTGVHEICKFDGQRYQCFDARNDIGQFVHGSAALGSDGRITFGGRNGIYSFYPNNITFEQDTFRPKVYLTNFKVFNKQRHLGQAYELTKEVRLPFEDKIIAFEFSGLHFLHSDRFRYRHKLEPFEKEWVETEADARQAIYTNLSPGKYTFKALVVNADDFETREEEILEIKLTILPPWYRTWPAYLFYVLTGATLLFGIRRYELRRQLARAEASRLKELDAVKTRLYTNITHEFRTPLTVIMGVADKIKKDLPKTTGKLEAYPDMILRNSHYLLHLVNQMLDLSKLEAGAMPLHLSRGDLINFLKYLVESFHSYAKTKRVHLKFHSEINELWAEYDPDKLKKIVANLVTNAIKFTPEKGRVEINVKHEKVKRKRGTVSSTALLSSLLIQIIDTGPGIHASKIPYIFDRFYQVDDLTTQNGQSASAAGQVGGGTGIGLALTKELVQLMKGHIFVDSKLGKGTTFTVRLPLTRVPKPIDAEDKSNSRGLTPFHPHYSTSSAFNISEVASKSHSEKPLLLIIEDNPDVVQYLILCLEKDFRLQVATNGLKGWSKALAAIPDLIISDVMMPEIDGFELCDRLKKERLTSHIPVILLTAKADLPSRIAGLERGADAYLAKPFEKQELLVRIKKLLDLRRILQEKYRSLDLSDPLPGTQNRKSGNTLVSTPHTLEKAFLLEARQVVLAHLNHHDLDVNKLCRLLNMSRTQLHRKCKALTGLSATRFINSIRLSQAQKLLMDPQLSIKEVAYDVGFKSPNYFRRVFSEAFGCSPSEFRNKTLA